MSTEIVDRIEAAISAEIKATGDTPTRLLLGTDEWKRLCAFLGWGEDDKNHSIEPPRYNGISMYVVADENHLSVA